MPCYKSARLYRDSTESWMTLHIEDLIESLHIHESCRDGLDMTGWEWLIEVFFPEWEVCNVGNKIT